MIVTVHIADVGVRRSLALLRGLGVPGAMWSQVAAPARFGGGLRSRAQPGRVALIAAWRDDDDVDEFLHGRALATGIASGWHIRMRPVRTVGSWSPMPNVAQYRDEMDPDEQAAVLTLGRLRLRRAIPFLRASAPAEELVAHDPAVITASALARPPRFVATFSLWRSTQEMRDYATGKHAPGHPNAMKLHAADPFHHESAFIRLRPYATAGRLPGGSSTTRGGLT